MAELVWSPVYKVLEGRLRDGDDIILIIVPFAKIDALKQLHWVQTRGVRIKIVCRWLPKDLTSGVSDLEVFTYLRDNGCELYINKDIHLKLYVFESNTAFNTSGNLTLRGLGYSDAANIEAGNMLQLSVEDWAKIYNIIATSRQVDDEIFARFESYVNSQPDLGVAPPPPDLLGSPKTYTIASLPATETPAKLADFYMKQTPNDYSPEEVRRAMHDLVFFKVPASLSAVDFEQDLGKAFRATPFVVDFIALLKQERNLRFGAVNDWIHQKCEDVPLPYRWEIKTNTHILYDWLAHFFPEITWDRPNYSQVIYWAQT